MAPSFFSLHHAGHDPRGFMDSFLSWVVMVAVVKVLAVGQVLGLGSDSSFVCKSE